MNETKAIPMLLHCPMCNERHEDFGEFATKLHHTHACQFCGHVWRPAIVPTVGVQFLPGFKNEPVTGEPQNSAASNGGQSEQYGVSGPRESAAMQDERADGPQPEPVNANKGRPRADEASRSLSNATTTLHVTGPHAQPDSAKGTRAVVVALRGYVDARFGERQPVLCGKALPRHDHPTTAHSNADRDINQVGAAPRRHDDSHLSGSDPAPGLGAAPLDHRLRPAPWKPLYDAMDEARGQMYALVTEYEERIESLRGQLQDAHAAHSAIYEQLAAKERECGHLREAADAAKTTYYIERRRAESAENEAARLLSEVRTARVGRENAEGRIAEAAAELRRIIRGFVCAHASAPDAPCHLCDLNHLLTILAPSATTEAPAPDVATLMALQRVTYISTACVCDQHARCRKVRKYGDALPCACPCGHEATTEAAKAGEGSYRWHCRGQIGGPCDSREEIVASHHEHHGAGFCEPEIRIVPPTPQPAAPQGTEQGGRWKWVCGADWSEGFEDATEARKDHDLQYAHDEACKPTITEEPR